MNEVIKYQIMVLILLILLLGVLFYMKSQILEFNDIVCQNCINAYVEEKYNNLSLII